MNQPSDEQTDTAVLGLVAWARKHARAMGLTGVVLVAIVSSLVTQLATNVAAPAAGVDTQPLTNEQKIVPASGEQGFPVDVFCQDPLTKVDKLAFVPPDSQFAAVYTLDRTRNAIHETVTVRVYADPNREPLGTYNDDQHPAYVTKDAVSCITKKAGK